MAHEYQVVDSHHAPDAAAADVEGKFAGKTVVEPDAIRLQLAYDAVRAPQRLAQRRVAVGVAVAQVLLLSELAAKLVAPLVGSIEAQVEGVERGQVVGQRASVASQSSAVAHDAFRIESDSRSFHIDAMSNMAAKLLKNFVILA